MVEITNQMFIDENGKHMTRCWKIIKTREGKEIKKKMVMYVVPTDPSQIRRKEDYLYKPGNPSDSRRESTGATSGWKKK